jgi:hypothetical protein
VHVVTGLLGIVENCWSKISTSCPPAVFKASGLVQHDPVALDTGVIGQPAGGKQIW